MTATTLAEEIRKQAQARGPAQALIFEGRVTSYATFDRHASQVAQGLISAGVAPGDRVAYLGKNSDYYFELLIGSAKAGAVTVPVNWRLAAPEIAYILKDAAPKWLLVEEEFAAALAAADIVVPNIVAVEAFADYPGFAAWRDAQPSDDPKRDDGYAAPVLQLYTSGTTGHPKGAVLTNRSLLALKREVPADAQPEWNRWHANDVSLIAMPAFHISGSGWGLWTLLAGAKGVVVREFDPHRVLDLLIEYRINKIMMVPTAMRIVVEHPRAATTDFSFLKYICYGGAPIPPDLLRRCIDVFGCGFAQMYGMTETAGTVVGLPPEDHNVDGGPRMRSVGVALPGVELRVIDAEGRVLPAGETGEIAIRSPSNMAGYHNRPEATAETIDAEGWLKTGDAGYLDADGYLYLRDRIKDMIITGGENVYPVEVENALFAHPDVADVAVIGVPDEKWGEAVTAVVVPKPGKSLEPEALIAWTRARIAGYKTPKKILFCDALPRNPSGKVLRRQLREIHGRG